METNMALSIESIRVAHASEWDEIWEKCDYATYYHSRDWAEILSVYTRGRLIPGPRLIVFSDGKKAVIPLLLEEKMGGRIKNYFSSWDGDYGGQIAIDVLSDEHVALVMNYLTKSLIKKLGDLKLRINPFDRLIVKTCKETNDHYITHAIRLTDGFDHICKRWSKGKGLPANKAIKEGVTVILASTIDDWRAYYDVYQDSLKRWGDKTYYTWDWVMFEELWRRNSADIKLWLAVYQGKVISGVVCLYAKRIIVYWHGSTIESYFYLRPVNLLMYSIMKDACEKKYLWFDFGPSYIYDTVRTFKKRFGSETLSCPMVFARSTERRILTKIKNISKIWETRPINRRELSQKVLFLGRVIHDFITELLLNIGTYGWADSRHCTTYFGDHDDYEYCPYYVMSMVLRRVTINEKSQFADYGCGKGRVVCFASRYAFAKVVGIEINPDLAAVAKKNAYRVRKGKAPIEIVEADAVDFECDKITAFFFYNPFGKKTMMRVLDKIHQSLLNNPRSIHLIYYNPTHSEIFDKCSWLKKSDALSFRTITTAEAKKPEVSFYYNVECADDTLEDQKLKVNGT